MKVDHHIILIWPSSPCWHVRSGFRIQNRSWPKQRIYDQSNKM